MVKKGRSTMNRKIPSCWLLPVLLCVAGFGASAASERGEMIGHPHFTLNGCPLDHEWTDEVVTEALGLKPRMLVRLKNRFGIEKERLCNASWDDLEAFVRQANNPKHRTDAPDEALAFRAMQQRDESGKVKANGLLEALSQRAAISPPTALAKSVLPDAAGIARTNWTWLGPGNVGGRVRAISPHPTTPDELLIGSVSGGIWRTIDGGASWTPLSDFLPNVAVSCVVRDPSNANVIYACTGEGFFNFDAVRGLGIFKSTDNGNTWAQMTSTNPTTAGGDWLNVNRLAINPTNPQIMLAATNGGAYRSADGGASWIRTYGTIPATGFSRRVLDVAFSPVNSNIAVLGEGRHYNGTASDGAAVASSADGGQTWTRNLLNTATKTGNSGRVEIAIAKSNPSIVYALVDMNAGELYRSLDGGVTWTPNAPLANNTALTNVLSNQGWYNNTIWVAPNDPNRIIVGGVTLRMSIDGGVNWTPIGYLHSDHHALVSDPNYATNGTIYGGNDGGVHKSTNANTPTPTTTTLPSWTNLNNGLGITQFYGGAGKSGGRITGGTQDNGSLYWTGSTNWLKFFGGDGGDSAADPIDGNYIYGETQRGGIVRYTQALTNPVAFGGEFICAGLLDAGCNFTSGPINFIPPIRLDPNDANTLLVGADRLWKSNNVKASPASAVAWSAIKPSLLVNGNYISAIAVAPGNANIIWVGYNFGDVACTTNGTAAVPTWTVVPGTPLRMVTRITIDESNNNRVFIANGGYSAPNLHVTILGCTASPNYANIHNQLPAAPIRALTRHPTQSTWLYAGTEVGLFTSEDSGASWFTTNDGPGTVSVEEIFFLDATTVVTATHGRGMYSASAGVGPGLVQFTATTQKVLGSAGTVTVNVNRTSGIAGAITVNYATANGTATGGTDFTATSGTLSWSNGDGMARSFTIPILARAVGAPTNAFTVSLSSPTGGAVIGSPPTQSISIVTELFPANCQLPVGWTVPGTAQQGWSVVTNDANEGTCSLKSNSITDGQKAQIQFYGSFTAGNITFDRKVSSEAGYDCFRFFVDSVQQAVGGTCTNIGVTGASGEVPWGTVSVPVAAGTHTLLWSYEKDPNVSAGQDAAWIDAVILPIAAATVPGAPNIGTATPGNAQALITFTAPASDGGSLITGYTATCNPGALTATVAASPVNVTGLANNVLHTCSVKANNAIGSSVASVTVAVTPSASAAAVLVGVVSRKTHVGIGTFDVPIDTSVAVISGTVTVEPRTIGTGHTIYFQFNNTINVAGTAAVVDGANALVGASTAFMGNDVVVTIPAIADNKRVRITLTGVNGSVNPPPVSLGFLIGDINNTRAVTASDISNIKAHLGQTTTTLNFKLDVNASGAINSSDVSTVKARSGLSLP